MQKQTQIGADLHKSRDAMHHEPLKELRQSAFKLFSFGKRKNQYTSEKTADNKITICNRLPWQCV